MDTHRNHNPSSEQPPSLREIAHLATRLRGVAGPNVDPAERAAVLADKTSLLARIPEHDQNTGRRRGR